MKKFLLTAAVITFLHAQAQLNMTIQVPPTGVLFKSQLWNALIINNAIGSKQLKLGLVVSDATNHGPVLTATTIPFTVSGGVKQIKAADISIVYEYEPALVPDQDPNGFLSAGNYEACYTLYDVTNSHDVETLEDCINFTVEPFMPPMLNMPADQSVVLAVPQFSWLPPSPLNIFNSLSYNLIVAEVQPGQTSAEAIRQNIPVISSSHQSLFLTPALNPVLDTGKVYAWQVVAENDNLYTAQSEVWTFKISTSKNDSIRPEVKSFIELRNTQEVSGINRLDNKILKLKYYSFDATHDAAITFHNPDGKTVKQLSQKIVYGDNFFILTLDNSFKSKTVYSVEIKQNNNQKLATFFILQ